MIITSSEISKSVCHHTQMVASRNMLIYLMSSIVQQSVTIPNLSCYRKQYAFFSKVSQCTVRYIHFCQHKIFLILGWTLLQQCFILENSHLYICRLLARIVSAITCISQTYVMWMTQHWCHMKSVRCRLY